MSVKRRRKKRIEAERSSVDDELRVENWILGLVKKSLAGSGVKFEDAEN